MKEPADSHGSYDPERPFGGPRDRCMAAYQQRFNGFTTRLRHAPARAGRAARPRWGCGVNEHGTPVMTFAILGPVEIRAGNRPVAVTSARPQALLAATRLQANGDSPTSRLVDAIWGDEPPSTAPELVRTYVSALRRSIGGRIVARPSGYLVQVERG